GFLGQLTKSIVSGAVNSTHRLPAGVDILDFNRRFAAHAVKTRQHRGAVGSHCPRFHRVVQLVRQVIAVSSYGLAGSLWREHFKRLAAEAVMSYLARNAQLPNGFLFGTGKQVL